MPLTFVHRTFLPFWRLVWRFSPYCTLRKPRQAHALAHAHFPASISLSLSVSYGSRGSLEIADWGSNHAGKLVGSMAVSQCGNFCEKLWEARDRCWEKKFIKKFITLRGSSSFDSNYVFLRKKSMLRVTQMRDNQGAHNEIGRDAKVLGSKAALKESVEEHQRPLLCFPGG